MRLSITLILLACISLAMAQSTKIDGKERARLENQFKALKTFYINDDGLVVYRIQENEPTQNKQESAGQKKASNPINETTKTTTNRNNNEDPKIIQEEKKTVRPATSNQGSTYLISKQAVDPNEIKSSPENKQSEKVVVEKNYTTTEKVSNNDIKKDTPKSVVNIKPTKQTDTKLPEVKETAIDTKEEKKEPSKYYSRKSKIQKSPLKYKDMEEAAMAVDDLLEKLKKDQVQGTTRSGSMSTKIARGAGKSTLRKQTISEGDFYDEMQQETYNEAQPISPLNTESFYDEMDDSYIPTYYINGRQVNKTEVDLLNKKSIISREVRTRNTVSGNPAGEIWLEVKE